MVKYLILAISFTGLAACQPALEAEKQDSPSVLLVTSGGIAGQIYGCNCPDDPAGGLARYFFQVNEKMSDLSISEVIHVDAGHFADWPRYPLDSETIVKFFAEAGYRAVGVMLDDLNSRMFELDNFDLASKNSPFISSNIKDASTGLPVLKQFRIVETSIGRIAFLSIDVNESQSIGSTPEGYIVEDPKTALSDLIPLIRIKSDYIVLFANADTKATSLLAAEFPDIDLALNSLDSKNKRLHQIVSTQYAYLGELGKYANMIVLGLNANKSIHTESYECVKLFEHLPEDENTIELLLNLEFSQ